MNWPSKWWIKPFNSNNFFRWFCGINSNDTISEKPQLKTVNFQIKRGITHTMFTSCCKSDMPFNKWRVNWNYPFNLLWSIFSLSSFLYLYYIELRISLEPEHQDSNLDSMIRFYFIRPYTYIQELSIRHSLWFSYPNIFAIQFHRP